MKEEEKATAMKPAPTVVGVEPIVMWFSNTSIWQVEQVFCPDGLWPNRDSRGNQIFDNTHFKTPEEAHKELQIEVDAWLSFSVSAVKSLELQLAAAKESVNDAAKAVVAVKHGGT